MPFTTGWGKHGFCECHTTRAVLQKQCDAAAIHRVLRLLPERLREIVETDNWYSGEQKRRKGTGGR